MVDDRVSQEQKNTEEKGPRGWVVLYVVFILLSLKFVGGKLLNNKAIEIYGVFKKTLYDF